MTKKNIVKKAFPVQKPSPEEAMAAVKTLFCLLYTSDAADD